MTCELRDSESENNVVSDLLEASVLTNASF